jgi:hypothetical protein
MNEVKRKEFSWPRAVFLSVFLVCLTSLAAFLVFVNRFDTSAATKVSSQNIATTFDSYIAGLQGRNDLQVASLKTEEEFVLTSEKRLLKYIPGGTVEVAARAPCEIIYHCSLKNARWDFVLTDDGRRLYVLAPELKYNAPAVDLARYEINVVKYSYIRDEEEAKLLLQKQIPQLLDEIARKNIDSVRDTARLNIKEFVENWLLASLNGKNEDLPVVDRVFFADEADRLTSLLQQKNRFRGEVRAQ